MSENIRNFATQMCSLELLKIDLKELKEGITTLGYSLGDTYFGSLDEVEIKRGHVDVTVTVHRTENYFELDFHTEGTVHVPCDICLDDMEQPIETDNRLVVKFGEEYSEDDDLITVEKNDGVLDASWFVYEFIALNIPIKHVHAPGKCNPAMIEKLHEHSATRSSDEEAETEVDPRWSELEKLKSIIKD